MNRPRSWPKFSLRAFLLAIPLVALAMAYYQSEVMRLKRQHDAASYLVDEGVSLQWRELPSGIRSSVLTWLIGPEAVRHCVVVQAQNTNLSDRDLRHLRDMPYVQQLYLDGNPISDVGLEHVATLRQLRELSLSDTKVGNEGIQKLAGLLALESLVLNQIALNRYGYEKYLSVGWDSDRTGNLTADCLEHLHQLPNLRYLRFSFPFTPALAESLRKFQKVKIQILSIKDLNDEKMAALAGFPELESLIIRGGTIEKNGLGYLHALKCLKHLRVTSLKVNADGWHHATSPPVLEELSMRVCDINENTITTIARMSQLKQIALSPPVSADDCIDDVALTPLGKLANLQSLTLRRLSLTGACFQEIGQECKNLKILELSGCQNLSDVNAQHLSSIRSLESLTVEDSGMNGDGLSGLASLEQLRSLRTDFDFNDQSIQAATQFRNLTELSANRYFLSDFSVEMIEKHSLRLWSAGSAVEVYDAQLEPGFINPTKEPTYGALSNTALAKLLRLQRFGKVGIRCNQVTSSIIPSCFGYPGTREIVTNKTGEEFFIVPVPGVSSISVAHNVITISMADQPGSVIVTCSGDSFPDSLLKRTFPVAHQE